MKCLGLIGSTFGSDLEIYWRTIRTEVEKTRGPDGPPEMLVHSPASRRLREHLLREDWDLLTSTLVDTGARLARIGAECLVICGSSLNPVAPELAARLKIPVIDLGYSVAIRLRSLKYRKVAVLGVRTPAERAMWERGLPGVVVLTPEPPHATWLLERIDATLSGHLPVIEWKIETNRIVSELRRQGAKALVLADPNLSRWIRPGDSLVYPIDAAEVHAWTAASWILRSGDVPPPPCIVSI